MKIQQKAFYHLPGLFEFFDFYKIFLKAYKEHRNWFYDWCEISSIYGAPADCLWGGGRAGFGDDDCNEVLSLMEENEISARLTFSNSLLRPEHLNDKKCNLLCKKLESISKNKNVKNGIIIYSDLLLEYLKQKFPDLYFVSSTTKVITDFEEFKKELSRPEFKFVVPDFRFNKAFDKLKTLSENEKAKVEFLVNECCWSGCKDRKACYENVSYLNLGEDGPEHKCSAPGSSEGYKFSNVKKNSTFISLSDIQNIYLKDGFTNFKIEGRSLFEEDILEILLYYMTKSEFHENLKACFFQFQID